ncbi:MULTISPECIES: SDR family NAD(P)-dependent oxidoreductase [Hydrogenophaga]|uniref:Short-chain dehydrogenase/reductase SDR n=1 Tax=Hydrogenophaga intermedia TaxID=65786 RepID=A0A1L1PNR2_HYDIT|nr:MULTISPECIES: glucose 1-dehydrogenase [Hydrogenophaga]AOS78558.1 dehydrogenase [Hydrogenophaga sp. PBC]TMU75118.1 glucose 1-dehydrogenase [Hydrogenophaga intermedia]CDN88567.1 Short-chain dehydrogenase/reductase SDR [Hydrogenophaga intermedia]
MKLSGKVAIVTGGSRGIGAAIARRLAGEGAQVALFYRSNAEAADATVRAIEAAGGQAAAFKADVADEVAVRLAVREVVNHFGRVDALVNNAGIFEAEPVGEISRESFHRQFAVNAWSVLASTQAALEHFPAAGGAIVNVSSSLAVRPEPQTVSYSASKAAVDSLTLGCAIELGARGIRVNAVAPAITRTDMTADIPAEQLREETRLTPLGRLAEPGDIADVVAFLCSDDARWITGRSLLVDGGRM